MRPNASEQVDFANLFQALERRHDFTTAIALPRIDERNLATVIKIHHLHPLSIILQANLLAFQKFKLFMQMTREFVQKRAIRKHRQKR